MAKEQNIFDEENVVTQNWAKWDEVGKTYTGVYVDKEQRPNTLKGDGSMQTIYTLIQEDGSPLKLGGPGGRDLGQFNAIKFGTFVGVKFVAEIPPKKAGYNPSKQITVFSQGEMKLEVLDEYKGETSVVQEENVVPEM